MHRRSVVQGIFGAAGGLFVGAGANARVLRDEVMVLPGVMTVRGRMNADQMGVTLVHEHILANFQTYAEWAKAPLPYDRDEVVKVILPRLQSLKALGCRTFVDATAAYLGRDVILLERLSRESGLNILTVTGNYAAFDNTHLPPWVFTDTAEALAQRWIGEISDGIDGTSIRPGFIKLGFNGGPLSEVERKLIRAGALTHKETGRTIGAHTGPAVSAFEQLDVLEKEGVDPSAWIWIHAQNEPDVAHHIAAARRGAWIEFDGIDAKSMARHVALVTRMRDEGLLNHVLVSQDAGWYNVGQAGGGEARSYELLFTRFVPALRAKGFSAAEIKTLLQTNPAKAFTFGPRMLDMTKEGAA
jgi:phosphotriesterase-related protein